MWGTKTHPIKFYNWLRNFLPFGLGSVVKAAEEEETAWINQQIMTVVEEHSLVSPRSVKYIYLRRRPFKSEHKILKIKQFISITLKEHMLFIIQNINYYYQLKYKALFCQYLYYQILWTLWVVEMSSSKVW